MAPAEQEPHGVVPRTHEEIMSARQRRQTLTFLGLFAAILLIGFIAFGNWQQWWTIGAGSPKAAQPCPVQVMAAPEDSNVNVINGTDRPGLAAAVAKELQKRKFTVLSITTAQDGSVTKGTAEIQYGPQAKLAAITLSKQFPGKVKMKADDRESEAVDLRIGSDYSGMVSLAKASKAIKLKPLPEGCVPVTDTPSPSATESSPPPTP